MPASRGQLRGLPLLKSTRVVRSGDSPQCKSAITDRFFTERLYRVNPYHKEITKNEQQAAPSLMSGPFRMG